MTTGGDLQTKISSVFTQVPYMFKNASDFMSLANMKNEDLSGRRRRERERERIGTCNDRPQILRLILISCPSPQDYSNVRVLVVILKSHLLTDS